MTIALQDKIIYGPVPSRRFGESLGVNLLPRDHKACNFNCVYCQYPAPKPTRVEALPSLGEIESAFKTFARAAKPESIDQITIAGNGEPTLYPDFSDAVELLIEMRDLHFPGVPIGILSNSSTCHDPDIRTALERLDTRFMKLDAGNEKLFKRVNLPLAASFEDMIEGLCLLKDVVLQSLFFSGKFRNTDELEVENWIRTVCRIHPLEVQVYTLARPPRVEGLRPASKTELRGIANRLAGIGIRASVIG